jgi:signal peptidase II
MSQVPEAPGSPPSLTLEAPGSPPSQTAAPPSSAARLDPPRASITFLVVVTVLSAVADLASKEWATIRLAGADARTQGARKIEVIKDYFDFIYAMNPGGAWSFLRSLPEVLRRPFFLFISAAAIVFIVSVYRRVRADQKALKWGLPLALGGAIGNLADRIRYGSVIDFIDFYVVRPGGREHHWPTFNVADIAIVLGVGLMAADMIVSSFRRAPKPLPPAPAPIAEAPGPLPPPP